MASPAPTLQARGLAQKRLPALIRQNKLAVIGLAFLGFIAGVAVLAPYLSRFDPGKPNLAYKYSPPLTTSPDGVMLFGGDNLGRDVFTRAIYGARASLEVGVLAYGLALCIGVAVGALSGFLGGTVDRLLMSVVDIFLSIPPLLLLITTVAVYEPWIPKGGELYVIVIVIGALSWPDSARLVRGEVLSLKERDYVQAARSLGSGNWRIVWRHILPNAMGPITVSATLGVSGAMLSEATLSYLGVGIRPPLPSWGNMILDGQSALRNAWWVATFPGLLLAATTYSLYMLGDGLRFLFDPKRRS
jgi:peptide/nickel transport system permease protein